MKNYILDGKIPVEEPDIIKWARFFEDINKRIVAQDKPINNIMVSTVFLGIDHQYGDGPPLLFETMIFGGSHDQYQERYATYDEAIKGHEKALKLATTQTL